MDLNGQSWGLRLGTNGSNYSGDALHSTPLPVSTFLAKLGPCVESCCVEQCPLTVNLTVD